jgi:hypothetical protein
VLYARSERSGRQFVRNAFVRLKRNPGIIETLPFR